VAYSIVPLYLFIYSFIWTTLSVVHTI
jgi:hypothetical protein